MFRAARAYIILLLTNAILDGLLSTGAFPVTPWMPLKALWASDSPVTALREESKGTSDNGTPEEKTEQWERK